MVIREMTTLKFTPHFKKAFNKLVKRNPDCAFDILNSLLLFSNNPFNPVLKSHKLSGDKKELWSFSVQSDLRIIFGFETDNTAILVNIGSHDEVY
jgi:mRNA-degrading endonuclease YafQ of YafQ-DinJ toxin-antitoxin module